jgi:phage shock protein A
MASSGLFARISNLWRGFVSLWIADVEKNHPEIAYENAINSMVEKYAALKKATAAIIRRREDIEGRLSTQTKELAQVNADLEVAMETAQDDLALLLIQKKNQLDESVKGLNDDLSVAVTDADSAKSSLLQVQSEIRKLQAEKDNMLAKMHSADARLRVQEQLDGLSVDAEVKALENVRSHIKNKVAEANLGAELAESNLDQRLTKLRAKSGEVTAQQQLEAMKAARAAQKKAQRTI